MPKSVSPTEESSFASDPAEDHISDISDVISQDDFARSTELEIRGKSVRVYYDLAEMTPRLRKRLSGLEVGDNAEDAVVEYIQTIVTAWTLTDKAGNPVSLADVDSVSYRDLGKIAEAINRDLIPNA
jgi:hypothetical protein